MSRIKIHNLLFLLLGVILLAGCADYGVYLEKEDKALEIPDHQSTRLCYRCDSYLYIPFGAIDDEGVVTFRTSLRNGGSWGKEIRYLKDFSAIAWCYSKDYSSMLVVVDYWESNPESSREDIPKREALQITNDEVKSLSIGDRDAFDVSLFSQFSGYGSGPLSQITRKQFPQITNDFKPGKMEQVYLCYEIDNRRAKTFQKGQIIDFTQLNNYVNQVKRLKVSEKKTEEVEAEATPDLKKGDSSEKKEVPYNSQETTLPRGSDKLNSPSSFSESTSSDSDYSYDEEESGDEEETEEEYDENGYRKYKPYY